MSQKQGIPVIKFKQWLKQWDKVLFNESNKNIVNRKKPEKYIYLFSINAGLLRRLAEVRRRKDDKHRDTELGTQRRHDVNRSKEISRFLIKGYPLSENKSSTDSVLLNDLLMPGWLPTAILANILPIGERRGNKELSKKDAVEIDERDGKISLLLPDGCDKPDWKPESFPPIEIIDGQHRLWAFDNFKDNEYSDYELPVVAFKGLDITWQAYLFFTINVKPKKINRSLAYDLYPILRVQDWLEKSPNTANIYKETRAQEIVEVLWSYRDNPWYEKINMLGDSNSKAPITQAAFIRNLTASFFKRKTSNRVGGLFGSELLDSHLPLDWNRVQQAALIILIWKVLYEKVKNTSLPWSAALRDEVKQGKFFDEDDPAFFGKHSLISTDQGVRGVLSVINDLLYLASTDLGLKEMNWKNRDQITESRIEIDEIEITLADIQRNKALIEFLNVFFDEIVKFNWRTSSAPSLEESERKAQMVFKGSSGYRELKLQLADEISKSKDKMLSQLGKKIKLEY